MIAPPIDRIVIINDSSLAKGGATGLALASAEAFRALGYPVTLLTGDGGENPALTAVGIEVVALGQARLMASPMRKVFFTALHNAGAEKMVGDWISANDTPGTVYHLHGWAQIFSPAIFKPLNKVAGRLVLSAHDFFLVCPNGSYSFLKSGKVCPLVPQSAACVMANCDRRSYLHKLWRVARQALRRMSIDVSHNSPPILAIHERMRPFLERGGVEPSAIQALPNPVRPFRSERIAAENNAEFVFIGRLEDGKGPDLACAAARLAGAKLRIIGDGPMEAVLKRDYPEVIFSGRQPPEVIGEMVRSARALLMPSRYPEPYGLVAAEALWSGLPVIAADTAFLAGDILAARAGLACEPRDAPAFAATLRGLLDDDEATRQMSVNAFTNTRDIGNTFDGWIEKLVAIYNQRLSAIP